MLCGQALIRPVQQHHNMVLSAHGFVQVLLDYASQSFRLMAIAAGPLKTVNAANVADMDLLQAERCCGPMELLGLLVLSNKLHPASEPTIRALQERCACCGPPHMCCHLTVKSRGHQ